MTSIPALDLHTDHDSTSPSAQERVHAAVLDADNAAIETWVNTLRSKLALVIRDDDTLVDGLVRLRNLHPEMALLLTTGATVLEEVFCSSPVGANVALTGSTSGFAIDGIAASVINASANKRVLLWQQSNPSYDGIYVYSENAGIYTLSRSSDAITAGCLVSSANGVSNGGMLFMAPSTVSARWTSLWRLNGDASYLDVLANGSSTIRALRDHVPSDAMNPVVRAATLSAARAAIDPNQGEWLIKATGSTTARSEADRANDIINVKDHGAVGDGIADDTAAIQAALNKAWDSGFYQHPWSGQGGTPPVVYFPPGRYRITGTLTCGTGVSIRGAARNAHTTNHTRIIMDSSAYSPPSGTGDNRNKPILKFHRKTRNLAAIMNTAVTSSIEWIEFWYVTPGGTIDSPLSSGITPGDYPDGGALSFDVTPRDFRVVNCCFQHAPAAVRLRTPASGTGGDGVAFSGAANIYFENVEFDASCRHIWATDSSLDLVFKGCQFFGSLSHYENCTGEITYMGGCDFDEGHGILADGASKLDAFTLIGSRFKQGGSFTPVSIESSVTTVCINDVFFRGASGFSCVRIRNADGGSVSGNTIINSGFNSTPGSKVGAIRLEGCENVLVSKNTILTPSAASYNEFGIISEDSTGTGSRTGRYNFITNNIVNGSYNGATYRSQDRRINLNSGDYKYANINGSGAAALLDTETTSSTALKTTSRIDALGTDIVPEGSLLGATQAWDTAAAISTDGLYIVQVQAAPSGALANKNMAVLLLNKRTAGGSRLTAIMIDNTGSATGATISVTGATSVTVTIGATGPFYAYISYHRIGNSTL